MSFVLAAIAVAGVGMYASSQAQNKMTRANAQATAQQLAFQKEQQAKLDKQKEVYRQFEFTNPYADMKNQYAGMENVYEDLTVNTQAAEFQMEQGGQQRADIMQSLKGAAGSSGIAGLAQLLANQGQLQTRQVSADIGRQEQQNQMMARQAADQRQQLERQGASAVDMAQRGGEAVMQEAEMSRQSTLLGVAYGGAAGANASVQQAYANQQAGMATAVQMTQDRWNTASNMASSYANN
jgi:hypothetical protein